VVPHKSNYNKYKAVEKDNRYLLINPHEGWRNVINKLASCKCIISSSLHGLICSDAYNKPNIWLDEYPLQEGDLKFKDYFMSQSRGYIKITRIEDFNESQLYTKGNTIDLEKLRNAFPFR
jgi:pyruvyltransferase